MAEESKGFWQGVKDFFKKVGEWLVKYWKILIVPVAAFVISLFVKNDASRKAIKDTAKEIAEDKKTLEEQKKVVASLEDDLMDKMDNLRDLL